ncbi:glycosyltransferase family 39 protein [bacterium]|nr:glycosyltransferase family 39 protein [bacterium]
MIQISDIVKQFPLMSETRGKKIEPIDWAIALSLLLLAAFLYIPMLGNFHLFDPWENHYSQVTWETMSHNSFARLWYRNSNRFWSKPPLLFWMQMPFFAISIGEFMGRLPIALFSVTFLFSFYLVLSTLFRRRTALFSTLILMMSPQFFMLSRHIMVDLPFLALNTMAMLFLARFIVMRKTDVADKIWKIPRRNLYLYIFYFLEGWAFLAKGLLSVSIPGAALLIYLLLTFDFAIFFSWRNFKHHLIGMGIYLAVVMSWVGYMWYDGGFEFIRIFIWFHHFKRAMGVIHKPNDLYTLYVQIIGYAMFPWSAFIPAAIYHFFKDRTKTSSFRTHILLFSMFVGPYFFFSYSSTKFYHYVAPVLPFLAIMIGYYLDRLFSASWSVGKKIEVVVAILLVAAIGRDIGNKYGIFAHLITFYNNRSLERVPSFDYVIAITFTIFGLALFIAIINDKFRKNAIRIMFSVTALFMLYYFAFAMPVISRSYSLKPLIDKYLEVSPKREPIADYYKWFRRSSSFWLKNDITFLKKDKEKSVLRFFNKPGTQYVIMKKSDKKRFSNLMKRLGKTVTLVKKGQKNLLMRVSGKGRALDENAVKKYRPKSIPSDAVSSHAIFDKIAELESYKIIKGNVEKRDGKLWAKAGQTIEIDLYFRALQGNIPKDYMVFLHNEGDKKDMRTKGDENMAMGAYPTTYWKKGDLVRHPLSVRLPANSKNSYYIPYIGLYQEDYRANITNFKDVPNDGDNRFELMRIWLIK